MHELLFRSILLLIAAWMAGKLAEIYWWKPRKIQKIFMEQGIVGPPYIPFIGSLGELPRFMLKPPELRSLLPRRRAKPASPSSPTPFILPFPTFQFGGKNTGLSSLTVDAMEKKVNIWRRLMKSDEQLELDLYGEFEDLTQTIITKIMFGNDAEEGMQIAKLHSEQAAISSKSVRTFYIPGIKFIPTSKNRRSKWLRRKTEKIFHGLIERRLKNINPKENDWVSVMLSSGNMTRHQIVDECCAVLIAGSESTNILLAWVCLHLGIDKMWQEKARDEINKVLLKENRSIIEVLSQLKILNMIINEALRLYPSIPYVMKHSKEDVQLGELKIPAGIDIEVPIMSVHYDTSIWGDNAGQFDPSRFSNGVSKASKHPMAFMPFMLGPRICPGMNFSMIEAKVTLAMILQNFDITISPKYKHLPVGGITLKQGFGAQVILRKI